MATVGEKTSTIITVIKAKLMTDLSWPADRCRVSMRMNVPIHPKGDQYLIILPLAITHNQERKAGGGRRGTIKEARINIYLRQRMAVDDWYGDEHRLLNPVPSTPTAPAGYLDTLELIEDSLDLYNPESIDYPGKPMLDEPMRALFDPEARTNYASPEWLEGMVELEVKYRARRTNV